jgi:beta-phosphoglucomutase-like phosphatase (HAD superfamily)
MAFIFDMDSVIADTQKIHSRLESEMLAEHGIQISPEEITRRFSGRRLQEQYEEVFREAGLPCPYTHEVSEVKAARFMACKDEFCAIEGTVARIRWLHGKKPLAVASASRPQVIDLVLNAVQVRHYFDALTSSREVERGKPAPDVFLLAAKRLGVPPESCTVVEDGISGMLGAKAAGMRCIALAHDGRTDYPADLVVRDLRDVPDEWFLR